MYLVFTKKSKQFLEDPKDFVNISLLKKSIHTMNFVFAITLVLMILHLGDVI